jgi:hypothetical protein
MAAHPQVVVAVVAESLSPPVMPLLLVPQSPLRRVTADKAATVLPAIPVATPHLDHSSQQAVDSVEDAVLHTADLAVVQVVRTGVSHKDSLVNQLWVPLQTDQTSLHMAAMVARVTHTEHQVTLYPQVAVVAVEPLPTEAMQRSREPTAPAAWAAMVVKVSPTTGEPALTRSTDPVAADKHGPCKE